jgi:hypothetical protein
MPINGALVAADDDEPPPELTATDRVASMLELAGEDERAKVSLYFMDPKTKKEAWCEDYSPADFEAGGHAMIREKWGPGEYMVKLYGTINGKAGKPGYGLRRAARVTIQPDRSGSVSVMPHQQSSELSQVLAMLAEGQQRLLEALTTRPDPMANLKETVGLMAMMREAMGINAAPPATSSIKELLQGLQALKEARSLIEPEQPDPDNLMSMLPKVLETVTAVVGAQRAQASQVPMPEPVPTLTPPPSIAAAPAAPPESPHQPSSEADMIFLLKQALKPLIDMANAAQVDPAGADIEPALDYVCDKLPDDMAQVLEQPEWFEMLSRFVPEVTSHKVWFTRVRGAYLALPVGDDDPKAPQA